MHFGAPHLFWGFLFLPLMLILFGLIQWHRHKALARFGDTPLVTKLLPQEAFNLRPLKGAMLITAYALLIFSLTRPQFGTKAEMLEHKGVDIMVALDISRSMLAEDIVPNRLQRAKHEITKLINLLAGDRIGLIIFAGESFVQCPLTLDYGAANLFLESVKTDWIEKQGTDLEGAITLAEKSFPGKSRAGKVLLIISDGESLQGDALAAAKVAAKSGVRIYTVGVGAERGVPIPLKSSGGNVSYLKDRSGETVLTRMNPKILEEIALAGRGTYFAAGQDLNLTSIYDRINELEKSSFGMHKTVRYQERYQLFLALALVLLLLEFFTPAFIQKHQPWRGRFV